MNDASRVSIPQKDLKDQPGGSTTPPTPPTAQQQVMLTIKVLGGAGLLVGLIWLIDSGL